MDKQLSDERSNEVLSATPEKEMMWCDYQK